MSHKILERWRKTLLFSSVGIVGVMSGVVSYAHENITVVAFIASFFLIILAGYISTFRDSKIGFLSIYSKPIKMLTKKINGIEREMLYLGAVAMLGIILGVAIQISLGLVFRE